jgi:hypothetical protein
MKRTPLLLIQSLGFQAQYLLDFYAFYREDHDLSSDNAILFNYHSLPGGKIFWAIMYWPISQYLLLSNKIKAILQ